jgi:hypothetical protein
MGSQNRFRVSFPQLPEGTLLIPVPLVLSYICDKNHRRSSVYSGPTEISLELKLGRPGAVDFRVSGKGRGLVSAKSTFSS